MTRPKGTDEVIAQIFTNQNIQKEYSLYSIDIKISVKPRNLWQTFLSNTNKISPSGTS